MDSCNRGATSEPLCETTFLKLDLRLHHLSGKMLSVSSDLVNLPPGQTFSRGFKKVFFFLFLFIELSEMFQGNLKSQKDLY